MDTIPSTDPIVVGYVKSLIERAERAEAEVERLCLAIRNAPHDIECPLDLGWAEIVDGERCDCWKSEALRAAVEEEAS